MKKNGVGTVHLISFDIYDETFSRFTSKPTASRTLNFTVKLIRQIVWRIWEKFVTAIISCGRFRR
jgi:hypothetical protein